MDPYIMPSSDAQFDRNNDLTYHQMAAQNTECKIADNWSGHRAWAPSQFGTFPSGLSVSGSDLDTINSHSPKSYFSDGLSNTFSPGLTADQVSPYSGWNRPSPSLMPLEELSPVSKSSRPRFELAEAYAATNSTNLGFTGLPSNGFDFAIQPGPSDGVSHRLDMTAASFGSTKQNESDISYSPRSIPSTSSWYYPGYSDGLSVSPVSRSAQQENDAPADSGTGSLSMAEVNQKECPSAPRHGSRPDGYPQINFRNPFQAAQGANTQAQRKHNDEILMQGKRDGLTYKEIRQKMEGESPAESTLRGRFRALTKARKDRVRKPIWTKLDVSQPLTI